jgi:hypothetical protein
MPRTRTPRASATEMPRCATSAARPSRRHACALDARQPPVPKTAMEYHTQCVAIAKEVGDRTGEGGAYGNLSNAYYLLGDHFKGLLLAASGDCRQVVREPLATHISRWGTIPRRSSTTRSAWRLQRRCATGRERAWRTGTLGLRTRRCGTFPRPLSTKNRAWRLPRRWVGPIEYHAQHLAIAKEVGDRAGEGLAYGNLGIGHMHLIEYIKAVACGNMLKLAHTQSETSLRMGVVIALHVRAARPSRPGSSPGP